MPLKRDISTIGLLFTSLSCMIGSGWLFGAFYTAQIAGPAAALAWPIGGLLILIIAFVFAELSTMLPLAGGIARFTQFSHGTLVSFTMTWLSWLSSVAVAPTEVQAILQYYTRFFPGLTHTVDGVAMLSHQGLVAACIMLYAISWINIKGVQKLARYNTALTCWKLVVPCVVAVMLIYTHFDVGNFTNHGHFLAFGWHGVQAALPAAVVFSFLGFREATSLAGETKNPRKAVPVAVVGSVLICTLLYALIQCAFIGALTPDMLAQGWQHLHFNHDSGPFAGIALTLGITWLGSLVYVDSLLTPAGTGIIYTTTCARLNYAMAKNKYMPAWFKTLNPKRVPANAVMFNCLVGMILFFPLPGWQALIKFQTVAIVLSYGVGPICLISLRDQAPQLERPFKLPYPKIIGHVAFFICNILAYWSGWHTLSSLLVALLIGWTCLFGYHRFAKNKRTIAPIDLIYALWLIPYIAGIMTISYLGDYDGGLGVIHGGWSYLWIGVFSMTILHLATLNKQSSTESQNLLLQESLLPFSIRRLDG